MAIRLPHSENNPEGVRSAVSRAYYASYLSAVEFIGGIGVPISRGAGGHGDVRVKLQFSGDSGLIEIAHSLMDLHGERIAADYHLERAVSEDKKSAAALVNQASEIIKTIDACKRSQERCMAVADSIKQWLSSLGSSAGPDRPGSAT